MKTATADLEGEVIEKRPWDHLTAKNVGAVLETFVGEIEQTPPLYSALKYKGKPYYDYARKGLEVPRIPRPVSIHSLSLLSFRPPFWEARVVCSRGTYVRTLVEDIAERLGTCATLIELVRERVGPYKKEHALSWQELRTMDQQNLASLLCPIVPQEVLIHA